MVITLQKVRAGRRRTNFLHHMVAKYPDLRSTALWLAA
jgi:hypothetical protein